PLHPPHIHVIPSTLASYTAALSPQINTLSLHDALPIFNVKTLKGHRQKPDSAHHRSSPPNPIVHWESGEPTVLFSVLVQIATHAGHSHRVLIKLQPLFFEFYFGLEHSVSCFLCPARF